MLVCRDLLLYSFGINSLFNDHTMTIDKVMRETSFVQVFTCSSTAFCDFNEGERIRIFIKRVKHIMHALIPV